MSAGRAAGAPGAEERSAVDVLGLACRFPESTSAAAFWANLAGGVDMLTADARRWPPGALGTPARFGKVPHASRFDAGFFAVHGKQAQARALAASGQGSLTGLSCWTRACAALHGTVQAQ